MNATNRAWFLSIRKLPHQSKVRKAQPSPPKVKNVYRCTIRCIFTCAVPPLRAVLLRENFKDDWHYLCACYDNRCLKCGRQGHLTKDHVLPKSQGGTLVIHNTQPLCKGCNVCKSDHWHDYRDGRCPLEVRTLSGDSHD